MRRLLYLFKLLIVVFALLLLQLARWQLVRTDLAELALNQRSEAVPLDSGRADILDRNGKPLTGGGSRINLAAFPVLIPQAEKYALPWQLAPILGKDPANIAENLQKGRPFFVARGLNRWQIQALRPFLGKGLVVVREKLRYREPALAPHLIGYLRTADQMGVTGIEALANEELSQVEPVRLAAIVDANRRLIPGLGFRIIGGEGKEGKNISTTLDIKIQQAAQEELVRTGQRGAVVVVDVGSGEVLAAASNPTFDPNQVEAAFGAPNSPLLNRTIHNYYPGSVFKIVVTAAALEEKVTSTEERFFDPGYRDVGAVRFRCWYEGGHGELNLATAFAQSCNSVYVELGQRLGLEMVNYARKLGLGEETGLGLPGEKVGSLPGEGRYAKQDFGNMALGQRGIQATPMQVARLLVTVLQGREVQLGLFPGQAQLGSTTVLSPGTRALLRAMMAEVVERGTGTAAQIPVLGAGGKTGSAQTGRINSWGQPEVDAWFAGFFPLLNPRYVIVVLLEGGESGSFAAGIFRRIAMKIA